MSFPNQDYSKRGYLLPAGCKDLADAIKREQAVSPPAVRCTPIWKQVRLPEKVSVRFLAEISGRDLRAISAVMHELRIAVDINRSVDFVDAQRILRRYGIWAERGTTRD